MKISIEYSFDAFWPTNGLQYIPILSNWEDFKFLCIVICIANIFNGCGFKKVISNG